MVRPLVRAALVLSLALIGCRDDDPMAPPPVTALTSATPAANISGSLNSERLYRITVGSGATELLVTTRNGTGDVDLVVSRSASPTPNTDNACEEFGTEPDETCSVVNPQAGEWYILLIGAPGGYAGVTLTATVTQP